MQQEWEYVGFWARTVAAIIDLILQLIVCAPLTIVVYGHWMSPDDRYFQGPLDIVINVVLPAAAVIGFWLWKGATPGKLAMSARVVDADTGDAMTTGHAVLRYFAYLVSAIPLADGFIWAGLDRRKQGWHDKIAGTVVIRPAGNERVRFPSEPTFKATEPRF